MKTIICSLGLLFLGAWLSASAQETVGERPYEMVWANRTTDTHPPLVNFENLDGWKVETADAVAAFTLSREQQIWGDHVGKLVYRGDGKRPRITLRPPSPIAVPPSFDCINFWVYGNNWAWVTDKSTPRVEIAVLLRGKGGAEVRVPMSTVQWQEWWVMHRRLQPEQLDLLKDGATFEGIQVTNGRNKDDRKLYFSNLAIYKEELKPLTFEPRRQRGIDMFEGQGAGLNTGSGRLPFPTREQTILPDNLARNFKTTLTKDEGAFLFRYRGNDGTLEYRYEPKTGTLGDVTARWVGRSEWFQPMADGGVYFSSREPNKTLAPEKIEALG